MNRCFESRARRVACAALAGFWLFSFSASAQGIRREAPKDVVLGQMAVDLPPDITINGKPDRLSPGSRIRDLNNMLVLSGSLAGKTVPVVYRRDAAGLVHEAWILTPEEYAKLGGIAPTPEGALKLAEMLAVIFGARK